MTHVTVADRLSDCGVLMCRACGRRGLVSVLDLGLQPLANELLVDSKTADATFPLHLHSCPACGLGQVGEYVLPERIFGDYPYLSSVSSSWVEHARAYARSLHDELDLQAGDLVVEVASNDGYLLKEFRDLGVPVLGVEPAANVAAVAQASGVDTLTAFFGRETAARILGQHPVPRLVVANNVLAHVPDLDDFMGGLALLCGPHTVITVENPSYLNLLEGTQFDTIYHEHYSYLSAHAVQRLAWRHDLALFRVQDLPTHGGSYRFWLARPGVREVEASVPRAVATELSRGLLSPALWVTFAERSARIVAELRGWLQQRQVVGDRVAGYGAAAKGNTLLNAAAISRRDLLAVADGSPEKQGKLLPGTRIPVVAPASLHDLKPTHVLLLPWNLAEELVPLVAALAPDAECWTAVPKMQKQSR